ncbi:MAG TPA: lysophospholipid acyltransferase family protein [Gemmatimonadaceae bacterium]|nr:lysophospholipid acyltransferase family protein [Gemmatimonadaceae bacterium]
MRLASTFGAAVLGTLGATWRLRRRGEEHLRTARAHGGFAYSLWHGEMLPVLWSERNKGIAVLVSEHSDGEIIARILEAFGCRTVRGSTTRGGGRALLALVRELQAGHAIAVTPDGPRGPREEVAPGVVAACQRAGALLLPVRASADRAWRLSSWDRFVLPKPFARISITYGQPLTFERGATSDATAQVERVKTAMHAARADGDA